MDGWMYSYARMYVNMKRVNNLFLKLPNKQHHELRTTQRNVCIYILFPFPSPLNTSHLNLLLL